jgi:pilus assembly protein CpaB
VVHPGQLALVVGMRLVFPMQPGDPLLWTHLPGSHTPERLSETLLGHTRAYALRVSNTTSSNGMLRPSDRVDVLVSAARPGESREVATLVQDVPILAVGLVSAKTIAFPQGRPAEYQSVSLAVAAEEAELLALAARAASTQFTLRNAEDHEREARRKPSQISDLLGEARALKLSLKRSAAVHAIRSARP